VTGAARSRRGWMVALPAVALVLVAICLRGPFAAVGPVLDDLRDELAVPTAALAALTSLPLVCFGLLSPAAPALAARLGLHRALVTGALVLTAGIALRLAGTWGMFVGTAVLCGGIAVVNVLLPAAVRAEYGDRSPTALGVTTASIAVSPSLGTGLAEPLTAAAGSAVAGLALWAGPAVVATAGLVLLARARPGAPAAPAARVPVAAVLRDRVALAVTAFFGLQSLSFYAMLTWLPSVLQDDAGVSGVAAGALVALAAGLGAPASLVVPPLARRQVQQAAWVVCGGLLTMAAIVGLLLAPAAVPVLWALLYGLGTGVAFPLGMTLFVMRSRDVGQTGRLSAAAQSAGYLLAATGPFAVGVLHDATGGWAVSLLLLLGLLVLQVLAGLAASRPRFVADAGAADARTAPSPRL
jgi:MFS transporter, CP family, cyanate transporter